MTATSSPAAVIVLAAGEGTRMKSRTPKLLHPLGGRSLLDHAVRAARSLRPDHLAVVVGHAREQLIPRLAELDGAAVPVVQERQLGTGHATRTALEALPALTGTVVVTTGDTPLLRAETLARLVSAHADSDAAATVLTAEVPDPTGYGRILRDAGGGVVGIVEHADADPEQRAIAEINSGIFAFDASALGSALGRLATDNKQGEEYLTDVLGILRTDGLPVGAVRTDDHTEILGVNNRLQLAELGRALNQRILRAWMLAGVTIVDPATTWIDDTVTLEPDATLHPNTQLRGTTWIARDAEVGPDTTLTDCRIESGARVLRTHGEGARIGPNANVGPYAYLRPGTKLAEAGKIGTFVETKNADIGEGTKVPHLSYVGDATIGEGTNIGAGTIFANYDGVHKHHTSVGAHTFVGSDSVLVAPRSIADGSYVAAGSTVVKDVRPGELAVARGQQRNVASWVERRRGGTKTAEAAKQALDQAGKTVADDASSESAGSEGSQP